MLLFDAFFQILLIIQISLCVRNQIFSMIFFSNHFLNLLPIISSNHFQSQSSIIQGFNFDIAMYNSKCVRNVAKPCIILFKMRNFYVDPQSRCVSQNYKMMGSNIIAVTHVALTNILVYEMYIYLCSTILMCLACTCSITLIIHYGT